jgi:hypothetical protein
MRTTVLFENGQNKLIYMVLSHLKKVSQANLERKNECRGGQTHFINLNCKERRIRQQIGVNSYGHSLDFDVRRRFRLCESQHFGISQTGLQCAARLAQRISKVSALIRRRMSELAPSIINELIDAVISVSNDVSQDEIVNLVDSTRTTLNAIIAADECHNDC